MICAVLSDNLNASLLEQSIRKEGNVLFNDELNIFYLVIWCRTYGKEPFRQCGKKPAATTTWATLSD